MHVLGRVLLVASVVLGLSGCSIPVGGPTVPPGSTASSAADPSGSTDPEQDHSQDPELQSLIAANNAWRLKHFEQRLRLVKGATVSPRVPPRVEDFWVCGRLNFDLPVDHRGGTSRTTPVEVEVCEDDQAAAVMVGLSGYGGLTGTRPTLGVNNVAVTHRFAQGADKRDLPYLTAWQAASDTHVVHDAIVDALGWQREWLVSGSSKGAAAALFYRFYYEEDTTGVFAWSAELNPGNRREPYVALVESGGDLPECFAKITALQKRMLADEPAFLQAYAGSRSVQLGEIFGDLAAEYEYIVVSLPLFVMRHENPEPVCRALPDKDGAPEGIIRGVLKARELVARERLSFEAGWAQELAAYLGWSEFMPVDDEIRALMTRPEILEQPLVPRDGPTPSYDRRESMALWRWLNSTATRVMFIDGANDVFAANRPKPDAAREIMRAVAPRRGHGGLDTLSDSDWTAVDRALVSWAVGTTD